MSHTRTAAHVSTRLDLAGTARRVAALARAETLQLRRTPMALVTAVVMPVALVLLFRVSLPPEVVGDRAELGAFIVIALTGSALILVVYYNLVTAVVARREDLVLKRLRCGELSDAEILAGTIAPGVLIAWAQILVGVVAAATVFDMAVPVNAVLVVVGIVLGTAVLVLLALASAALTRSVQSAELTTTPLLVVSLALGGLMVPLHTLPEALQRAGQAMPLTPVVDLVRLGLTGATPDGEILDLSETLSAAVVPAGVLLGWLVLGAWATRWWFRWEPRR